MSGLSREARELIAEVGGADGPSVARRARVRKRLALQLAASGAVLGVTKLASAASGGQALGATAAVSGVSAGAVSAAGAASAAGSALSLGTVALWVAGGMALGTATMVPVAISRVSSEPAAVVSVTHVAPKVPLAGARARSAPGFQASPSPVTSAAPVDTVSGDAVIEPPPSRAGSELARARERQLEPAPVAAPVAEPAATPGATAAVAAAAPSAVAPSAVAVGAETRLLESAQRELASGNGERALELLGEHERGFPAGVLSEERMFARVIALCQLGRGAEARAAAESFLRAAPRSPLVARVRKSCAFAGEHENSGEPSR